MQLDQKSLCMWVTCVLPKYHTTVTEIVFPCTGENNHIPVVFISHLSKCAINNTVIPTV